jgi:SAM-dependent methyltransferase
MSDTRSYYERYWQDPSTAVPNYDPTTPARKAMLAKALADVPKGSRVLDMGCGTGEFTGHLADIGFKPVGIDLSQGAVGAAAARFPALEFHVGPPEDFLDRFAGQFQAVWSTEVIEHVFDLYGFFAAMNRFLTPGGKLILTTPYHGLIKNLLIDFRAYDTHYNPFGGHIRFFNRKSLGRCLTHCGFTPIQWAGLGRTWPLYRSFFVVATKTGEPQPAPPADS